MTSQTKGKSRETRQRPTTQNANRLEANSQQQNTTSAQEGNSNLEPLVTAEQVAKRYSVTSRAVLLWAAQGIIPSIRIGTKTVRFNLAAVRVAVEGGDR